MPRKALIIEQTNGYSQEQGDKQNTEPHVYVFNKEFNRSKQIDIREKYLKYKTQQTKQMNTNEQRIIPVRGREKI